VHSSPLFPAPPPRRHALPPPLPALPLVPPMRKQWRGSTFKDCRCWAAHDNYHRARARARARPARKQVECFPPCFHPFSPVRARGHGNDRDRAGKSLRTLCGPVANRPSIRAKAFTSPSAFRFLSTSRASRSLRARARESIRDSSVTFSTRGWRIPDPRAGCCRSLDRVSPVDVHLGTS